MYDFVNVNLQSINIHTHNASCRLFVDRSRNGLKPVQVSRWYRVDITLDEEKNGLR